MDAGVDRTRLRRFSQSSESRNVRAQAFGGEYATPSYEFLGQFAVQPYEVHQQLDYSLQGEEKEVLENIVLEGLKGFEISSLSPHGLLGESLSPGLRTVRISHVQQGEA